VNISKLRFVRERVVVDGLKGSNDYHNEWTLFSMWAIVAI
jgi:hypothetical protein